MTVARFRQAGGRFSSEPWDPSHANFRQRSEREFFEYMLMDTVYPPYLAQFDAATAIFAAIGRLLANGTSPAEIQGQVLMDALLTSSFEGVSGHVTFDTNGDRPVNFIVQQLMPGWDQVFSQNSSFVDIGS